MSTCVVEFGVPRPIADWSLECILYVVLLIHAICVKLRIYRIALYSQAKPSCRRLRAFAKK